MGLTTQPQLQGMGDGEYILSFGYNFFGDALGLFNLNGLPSNGSVFTLNTGIINGVSNIKPFRSIIFTMAYDNTSGVDGELVIFSGNNGTVYRIGPGTTLNTNFAVTGVLPLLPTQSATMQFGKVANPTTNAIFGRLSVVMSTEKMPAFISPPTVVWFT